MKIAENSVLLVYHHPIKKSSATISQHINSFSEYLPFPIYPVNTEYKFPVQLLGIHFPVIILHYSLFSPGFYQLSDEWLSYLSATPNTYKIAFFQDEYQYCIKRFDFINRFKIQSIYTLLEYSEHEKVYYKYTEVKKVTKTLTGYVGEDLKELAKRFYRPYDTRKYDVTYRARRLEYFMGKGAQEKANIGEEFLKRTRFLGLICDIKMDESSRFNGNAWYEYLAESKAVLGVEAGVSIYDLDDTVRIECQRLISENPGITFGEMYRLFLHKYEDNVHYRQISPRVFETAALKVLQILFEGEYSGVIKPMKHYIPLKKDFSNLNEVLVMMKDKQLVDKITEQAYQDLICSGNYSYKVFHSTLEYELRDIGIQPTKKRTLKVVFRKIYAKQKLVRIFRLLFSSISFPGKRSLKAFFLKQ